MYILDKLLKKLNIDDVTKLNESEQRIYDNYRKRLSEGEITVENIKEFCKQQLSLIEGKFKDLDNSSEKNQRLIISYNHYKALLDCIEKPQREKEKAEKELLDLLN